MLMHDWPNIRNYIGGTFRDPVSGRTADNIEPATGQPFTQFPVSDAADVQTAVDAAKSAAGRWATTSAADRSAALLGIADAIEDDLERFAQAESTDTGKPISLARQVDIPRAIANFRFFATRILHTSSETHAMDGTAINYTLRSPIGVVGLISPWNLPLYLLSWKIAPALACGNVAIAKPSEVTPLTAHLLAEVCDRVGFPPGVLNIVHGLGADAGAAIVEHPAIKAISFTGGTATGQTIARTACPMFKKVSLELGGKNPNIVFADADMSRAVPESVRAAFANQGQICLCGSRLLVERSVYDDFVREFVEAARSRRIGDPLDDATQHGATVSKQHYDKVLGCIELARQEGGEILCGGGRPAHLPDRCSNGYFIEPTVIADLDMKCRTNQEEIFGPVVSVIPFDDESHAVELANATQYGLSASVWTQNLQRAHRTAAALEAGTVWVNCWLVRDLRVPFGGVKQSGVGREGGDEAIRFFTEPKNVCIHLGNDT